MPPFTWPVEPIGAIQQFEARYTPDAGALFMWAVSAVESLHYLDDVDQAFDNSHGVVYSAGHSPDVIDVAHARWATGTSITAVDLCAAGLGRAFGSPAGNREFDIEDFGPSRAKNRASLPLNALSWVDGIINDPQYNTMKSARDWLTHKRTRRHFSLSVGGTPLRQRLALEINSARMPVRDLIVLARDFASHHVSAFVQLLPRI